jgi:hypothetical protein
MNFEYNGLGMVFLTSDNFNARIFTRGCHILNKDIVKRMEENFISNEGQIEEKELFDKNLINLMNILSDKISKISLEISDVMSAEKPIYEFFNEYYRTFEMYGETADIQVENEYDKIRGKPYIMIEKTSDGCYNITYENEDGHYYVKILDTCFSKYSIYGDIKMSDIKNMTDVVKNVDMSEKYDNSGIIKNCEISPSYDSENVITMENLSEDSYNTDINIISRNYNVSISTIIKIQVPIDSKDLLPAILEISSDLKPYCHTVDFATEFSGQIVKKISDLKKIN